MEKPSYSRVQAEDAAKHDACPLNVAAKTAKSLCVQLVAVADFPSLLGHFRILGFTNNKDDKNHTMVVKGTSWGRRTF